MDELAGIAIVVLTYNRLHLLRQCVENVLLRTSSATCEILIWNNASADGTRAYLDAVDDPRIRIVHHYRNVGHNAYARAFEMTSSPYLIEVDDDIVDAPPAWDETLLDAFRRLPGVGYLAANLVNNPCDETAQVMYGREAHLYSIIEVNGIRLKVGRTGGGCTMTSRELYDRVGGFRQNRKLVFWEEDGTYIRNIEKLGYRAAYLADLEVLHAGGSYYSEIVPEKQEFQAWRERRRRRRDAVKRILLCVPFVRPLNQRHGWFQPPAGSG